MTRFVNGSTEQFYHMDEKTLPLVNSLRVSIKYFHNKYTSGGEGALSGASTG